MNTAPSLSPEDFKQACEGVWKALDVPVKPLHTAFRKNVARLFPVLAMSGLIAAYLGILAFLFIRQVAMVDMMMVMGGGGLVLYVIYMWHQNIGHKKYWMHKTIPATLRKWSYTLINGHEKDLDDDVVYHIFFERWMNTPAFESAMKNWIHQYGSFGMREVLLLQKTYLRYQELCSALYQYSVVHQDDEERASAWKLYSNQYQPILTQGSSLDESMRQWDALKAEAKAAAEKQELDQSTVSVLPPILKVNRL